MAMARPNPSPASPRRCSSASAPCSSPGRRSDALQQPEPLGAHCPGHRCHPVFPGPDRRAGGLPAARHPSHRLHGGPRRCLHYRSDLLLNVGILVALALTGFGWYWLDPLFGLAIALYILWSAYGIARDSFGVLMDQELPADISEHMLQLACQVPGVEGAHDLRTRLSGNHWFVQLHLELPGEMSLSRAHVLCDEVEAAIRAEYPRLRSWSTPIRWTHPTFRTDIRCRPPPERNPRRCALSNLLSLIQESAQTAPESTMKAMHPVVRLADLREDRGTAVKIEDTEILLLRVGDEARAFQAKCPHAGAPLADGAVCQGRWSVPGTRRALRSRMAACANRRRWTPCSAIGGGARWRGAGRPRTPARTGGGIPARRPPVRHRRRRRRRYRRGRRPARIRLWRTPVADRSRTGRAL